MKFQIVITLEDRKKSFLEGEDHLGERVVRHVDVVEWVELRRMRKGFKIDWYLFIESVEERGRWYSKFKA